MDTKTLQTFPLAQFYAWRAPFFLKSQEVEAGAAEQAAARWAVRHRSTAAFKERFEETNFEELV